MKLDVWCVLLLAFATAQSSSYSPFQDSNYEETVQKAKGNRPHIIFFLGDDIGYNDVGWHNPLMYTPFMNELAKNGITLENYYTNAMCTPSRAALLTGYYAHRLGIQRGVLSLQEPYGVPTRYRMLPKRLKEAHYSTHAFGKWHVGYCDWQYTPNRRGFDTFLGFYNGAEENYLHCIGRNFITTKDNCTSLDFRENETIGLQYTGIYSTELYTRRAVELIQSHRDENTPLFIFMSLTDSHFPLQPPSRYLNLCSPTLPEPRRRFCGGMAVIDESMSNITAALRARGLYDNSVIIFASDNGGMTTFGGNNFPLRGDKATLWEGGTRVPAFIHSALLKEKGYINKRLFHVTDWFATITNLAGVVKEFGIDGVDQWDALSENKPSARKDIPYYMDVVGNGTLVSAIRDDRYKLFAGTGGLPDTIIPESDTIDNSFNPVAYRDGRWSFFPTNDTQKKLYDLDADPSESNNLALSMPQKVNELWKRMLHYKSRSLPAVKLPEAPEGDPVNFNNVFSPGWCIANYEVPFESSFNLNEYELADLHKDKPRGASKNGAPASAIMKGLQILGLQINTLLLVHWTHTTL